MYDAPGQGGGERQTHQQRQQHHEVEFGLQAHPRVLLGRQPPRASLVAWSGVRLPVIGAPNSCW
jgi:hypothetical protein